MKKLPQKQQQNNYKQALCKTKNKRKWIGKN
jgi:hypothetical protein